jgi:iron complex transport system permease protein
LERHKPAAPAYVPESYDLFMRRKYLALVILLAVLVGLVLFSLTTGSSGLTLGQVLETLAGKGSTQSETIVFRVRLPRIATAVVVGAALALSGCVMQNVLHNPLASASTLGVSQGAAFGAALAIIVLDAGVQNAANAGTSVTISSPGTVTVCAFAGGIATTWFVLVLSRLRGVSPATMILAGVALSSMFTGGTTLLQYFADDVQVATVVYWTFGDLGRPGWREIAMIGLTTLAALGFFQWNRWNYNALESGGATARSLGVNVDLLTYLSMAVCTLIAAMSVAFVGVISFVGLIAPHMVRRFSGNDYRFLIPGSALGGSILLLVGDLVSKSLLSPVVLPIGAITSFLGAPVFLWMLFKGRARI